MKLKIRPAIESDHAFIYATYLRNRWFDKANKTTLKRSTWSKLQHNRLEGILNNELVLVGCLDEDPDTIVGYCFIDGNVPYSYVKLDWREVNPPIADRLLKELK